MDLRFPADLWSQKIFPPASQRRIRHLQCSDAHYEDWIANRRRNVPYEWRERSPVSFNICGEITGADPEISVTSNGSEIVDNSIASTDFGSVAEGSASVKRTFTVTNHGKSVLTLGSVSLPTGFSLVAMPCCLASRLLHRTRSTSFCLRLNRAHSAVRSVSLQTTRMRIRSTSALPERLHRRAIPRSRSLSRMPMRLSRAIRPLTKA